MKKLYGHSWGYAENETKTVLKVKYDKIKNGQLYQRVKDILVWKQ